MNAKNISRKIASDLLGTKLLTDELAALLHQQIANEMYASYFYLAAAAWLKNQGFDGFATFLKKHGIEERVHADKVYDYLCDTGTDIAFKPVPAPPTYFKSVLDVCEQALQHEVGVTADWKIIGDYAVAENNLASVDLAQFFMKEQVEEEDMFTTLLQKVKMADTTALLMLDEQYGD